MSDRSMKVAASALAIVLGLAGVGAIGFAEGAIAQEMADRKKEADRLSQQGLQQYQANQLDAAVRSWQRSLTIYQELKDQENEKFVLSQLGKSADRLFEQGAMQLYNVQIQDVVNSWEQALVIYQQAQNRRKVATVLIGLSTVYLGIGNSTKALDFSQKGLGIARELNEPELEKFGLQALELAQKSLSNSPEALQRKSEAERLLIQGLQQYRSSQFESALQSWQKALPIYQSINDRQGEGAVFGNLGNTYMVLGDYQKSIEYHEKNLKISRDIQDQNGQISSLVNLGSVYQVLGNYRKAIEYQDESLRISKEIKNYQMIIQSLNSKGNTYIYIGNYNKALILQEESLEIAQKIKDELSEAATRISIGNIHFYLGSYDQAVLYQEKGLAIARSLNNSQIQGYALANLGNIYASRNKYVKAIDSYERSLSIARQIKDQRAISQVLGNLGAVYGAQGDYSKAINFSRHSLVIALEAKDRYSEIIALSNLGTMLAEKEPTLALIFYKQSINISQLIRQEIKNLPRESQELYVISVAKTYRQLADLLLTQGRSKEAQSILELLKVQESKGYGNDQETNVAPIQFPLHPLEFQALQAFEKTIASKNLTLETLKTIGQPLTQNRDRITQDMNAMPIAIGNPQAVLKANPNALLIQNLVVGNKLWVLWTNASGNTKAIVVPNVTQKELTTIVETFRKQIGSPYSNLNELKATSQKLHNWLIPPELQAELKNNPKPQLLFSLDHVTRYIPVAALYDGTQYLAQRYTLSNLITMDSDMGDRLSQNGQSPSILGLGTSKRYGTFSALENVPAELRAIVQDGTTKGIYPGKIQLNEAFTAKTLTENLNAFRVLHIATHGSFNPKSITASFLLLGNGDRLPITDIATLNTLNTTHLIVLSACETGISGQGQDGTEISGISGYFLRRGAKSVLASLWSVNDASTSLLMQQFYQNLSTRKMTKAQALQQSQQDFINGKLTPTDALKLRNEDFVANIPADRRSPRTIDYTHPFFWAPFTLTGNNQ